MDAEQENTPLTGDVPVDIQHEAVVVNNLLAVEEEEVLEVVDEAEAALISVLEDRQTRAGVENRAYPGWTPSAVGERPPLGILKVPSALAGAGGGGSDDRPAMPSLLQRSASTGKRSTSPSPSHGNGSSTSSTRPKLADIGLRVRKLRNAGMWRSSRRNMIDVAAEQAETQTHEIIKEAIEEEREGEAEGDDQKVFEGVGGVDRDAGTSAVAMEDTAADRLISGALAVDRLFADDNQSVTTTGTADESEELELPLINNGVQSYGSTDATDSPTKRSRYSRFRNSNRRRWRKIWRMCCLCIKCDNHIFEALRWSVIRGGLFSFLKGPFAFCIAPLTTAAVVKWYYFQNVNPDFNISDLILSQPATISWTFLFIVRLCCTLQLARLTEFLLVDVMALHSKLVVRILGPLVTLSIIQSKGWPLIGICWSIWNLCILHGTSPFVRNWLYWTGFSLFSDANSGAKVLDSPMYTRALIALLIVGALAAIKRTYVAMLFGKKTFLNYKQRLESILGSILLISEVADLSEELDALLDEEDEEEKTNNASGEKKGPHPEMRSGGGSKWKEMKFGNHDTKKVRIKTTSDESDDDNISDMDEDDPSGNDNASEDDSLLDEKENNDNIETDQDDPSDEADGDDSFLGEQEGNDKKDANWDSKDDSEGNDDDEDDGEAKPSADRRVQFKRKLSETSKASTLRTYGIKNMLVSWVEPINKLDKPLDASIHDILQFRKALTFMDEKYPFSRSFGPASTRDECIKSAQITFRKLLSFTPGARKLGFDVLSILATDSNGNMDFEKRRQLKKVFRPDRSHELTMVAFVQSCDTVYKRLRYFRASVGNSSVIDNSLERILNGFFKFILFLIACTIMNYNPWTLLLSLSTLLVSFAFAFGNSASKYIEGLLLIAVRRPYDLGDRILVQGAQNVQNGGVAYTWFVEDINLYWTTIRYASTNEVATVTNGSLANARIVNCSRSPFALVNLSFQFTLGATEEQINIFQDALTKFVDDRPRTWVKIVYFRSDELDADNEWIKYVLRVQHRRSWQDAGVILADKYEMSKFCFEIGKKIKIHFVTPMREMRVFNNKEEVPGSSMEDSAFLPGKTSESATPLSRSSSIGGIQHHKSKPSMGEAILANHLAEVEELKTMNDTFLSNIQA